MSAIDINYALKCQGLNQTQIAKALSVSPSVVSSVISGRASSYAVAAFIAEKLHTDVHKLWPEKYVFRPRRASKCS